MAIGAVSSGYIRVAHCCGQTQGPRRMAPHAQAANGDVTGLLHVWSDGDEHAFDRLIPLVYDELHRMAHRYLRGERADVSLQPTGSSTRSACDCSGGTRSAGRIVDTFMAYLRR